jgi:hypothetical protein
MPPESLQAVAVFAGVVAAAFFGLAFYDAVLFLVRGRTATISHGMWLLGQKHRWLPWVFLAAGLAFVTLLSWHFWE